MHPNVGRRLLRTPPEKQVRVDGVVVGACSSPGSRPVGRMWQGFPLQEIKYQQSRRKMSR